VLCLATWFGIEKTKLGSLSARGDRQSDAWCAPSASMCRVMMTLTYGRGRRARRPGLACSPRPIIVGESADGRPTSCIVVFAVVVIGGMGSIMGSIVTGFGLGVIEGLTKVFYPPKPPTR
jgi:branched-chain amino acid transport system permease protein